MLALVLLPSFAPDTFGRACSHHRGGHGGHHEAPGGSPGHHGIHPAAPRDGGVPHHVSAAPAGAAADEAPPSPAEHPAPHAPCTCAGDCTVSTSPGLVRAAGIHALAPIRARTRAPEARRRQALLPGPPDHVLPLATAPPDTL